MASLVLHARLNPEYEVFLKAAIADYEEELESCEGWREAQIEENIRALTEHLPIEISSDGKEWRPI